MNQYIERTVAGTVPLSGTAAEDATVTINRPSISGITVEPVTRQGAYFHKKLALDNSAGADVEEIAVVGVLGGAHSTSSGQVDIVSTYSGVVWAAQSPERFSYDDDGNMLADALRKYEWDAENRLIAVTSSNVVDGSLTKVEFTYDYMSRRASKTVYAWSAASNEFQISSFSTFIYDGWNLIKEISTTEDLPTGLPTSRVVDYYVWGIDLSGSLQGAGGIGGLLGRVRKEERFFDDRGLLLICHRPPGNPDNCNTLRINASAWPAHQSHGDTLGACAGGSVSNSAFLYTFDGNGNVSELLQPTANGPQPATPSAWSSVVAHYEYSPFGELIVSTGPEAQDNPFRFSTKYFVDELGIGDWGRRWYRPDLGRWLSRDPIGEIGGENLYCFVINGDVNKTDAYGFQSECSWAAGLCSRNIVADVPDHVTIGGITINFSTQMIQSVNNAIVDHSSVRIESYWGVDMQSGVATTYTRGFAAKSAVASAVHWLLWKYFPYINDDGYVEGKIQDDTGTCSMHEISKDKYDKMKTAMESNDAPRYHVSLNNCHHWAAKIMAIN